MATTADFKNGLYLDFNGKPCQIVWFQHVKPGKGPAFVSATPDKYAHAQGHISQYP